MTTQKERITQLINSKGISQYQIAAESGVNQSLLSRITNDVTYKMSLKTLRKLANYFKVDLYWLQTGKVEPNPNHIQTRPSPASPDCKEFEDRIRELERENAFLKGRLYEKDSEKINQPPDNQQIMGGGVKASHQEKNPLGDAQENSLGTGI